MSFVSKIIKSGSAPIYFITCKDIAGRDCYYFVLSTPEKIKMLDSVKSGIFDVNDYGKIIQAGYGKTPSEKVRKKMKDEYGFDMENLL